MQDIHAKRLSAQACDELAFRFIRKEWRDGELALMGTKWFDYRFVHPVQATYLFAHEYEKAYVTAFSRNYDRGGPKRVFKHADLFACDRATISGIWHARQIADEMGMPYEAYAREAIAQVMRFWKQSSVPRPTQLYSAPVIERVAEIWEELQANMLFWGRHEEYQADRFVGSRDQLAHIEWLFAQAALRNNPVPIIKRFAKEGLIERGILERRCSEALMGLRVAA